MSIDYVLVTSCGMNINAEDLPDASNWKKFDGFIQYQGSRDFVVNVRALSKGDYRPPWRVRWKIGPKYEAAAVVQEGGSSSKSAHNFLTGVFEGISSSCAKVAIDSPAGLFWLRA